jgi:pilus assembly protein Flp/PilA
MTTFKAFASGTGRQIVRFGADETGATAIEYGMIAAGVGACVAGAVMSLGSNLKTTFYDKLAALMQ